MGGCVGGWVEIVNGLIAAAIGNLYMLTSHLNPGLNCNADLSTYMSQMSYMNCHYHDLFRFLFGKQANECYNMETKKL